MQEEGSVAFGVFSTDSDARSLPEARTMLVSAVSTSRNLRLKVGPGNTLWDYFTTMRREKDLLAHFTFRKYTPVLKDETSTLAERAFGPASVSILTG